MSPRRFRQRGLPVLIALIGLAACSAGPKLPEGVPGHISGFAGVVAGDEARAVQAARDVLSAGGNAADAAVALYFTMAVTMPSSAGLGGGGICLVYEPRANRAEAIDFLPRASAGGAAAIPGNPRGIYALHAKHGRMRWESLIAPAERLARLGTALKGERLVDFDLAATLSRLRLQGPGDLYSGAGAGRLAAAYAEAGAPLTTEDLRGFAPRWRETVARPAGDNIAHFAPAPAGGEEAARRFALLLDGQSPPRPAAGGDDGTAGFAVADLYGRAVACSMTMGRPFGTGRVAKGSGILIAAAPAGPPLTGPVVVANHHSKEPRLALVASGSRGEAVSEIAAGYLRGGRPDGRYVAVHCASGAPSAAGCGAAAMPRGFGFAVTAGKD